ncbi:caspase family protein [Labilibacter marinus]|uniref:caspase family protein n=1 Tax=Labilibacter marinus TaxID=1477105 RepID=UPI00130159D4|nr:caspase family protein [Labilibacter marinus]
MSLSFMLKGNELIVQMGHLDEVIGARFSNNEKYIVSFDKKNVVIVWDIKSGAELLRVDQDFTITDCYFSEDDLDIITFDVNDRRLVRNINTGDLRGTSSGMSITKKYNDKNAIFYSRKCVAEKNDTIELLGDFIRYNGIGRKGKKYYTNKRDEIFTTVNSSVVNKIWLVGDQLGRLHVFKLGSVTKQKTLLPHISRINTIQFSKSENHFAVASSDRSIAVYRSNSLNMVKRLYPKVFPINCSDIDTVRSKVVIGNDAGIIRSVNYKDLLEVDNGKVFYNQPINDVKCIKHTNKIVSCSKDKYVIISNDSSINHSRINNNSLFKRVDKRKRIAQYRYKYFPKDIVSHIAVKDSLFTVSAYNDGFFNKGYIFNTYSKNKHLSKSVIKCDSNTLGNLKYNTDGLWGFNENGIFCVDNDGEYSRIVSNDTTAVKSFTFYENDLVVGMDSAIGFYNLDSNKFYDNITVPIHSPQLITVSTKKNIAVASNQEVFIVDNKKQLVDIDVPFFHTEDVTGCHFSNNDSLLISTGKDGLIKLWDLNKNVERVSIAPLGLNKKVCFTKDGYYMVDRGSVDGLFFKQKGKAYPIEQFDLKYNRPDIILSRLDADQELIRFYKRGYYKRLKQMGMKEEDLSNDLHLPTTQIINVEKISQTIKQPEISFDVKCTDNKYQLNNLYVWINNVPVFGKNGISIKDSTTNVFEKTINLELMSGNNKIQVSCLNNKGVESYKETFEVKYETKSIKQDLYVISIGTSKYLYGNNLKYAAKDADDITQLFKKDKQFKNSYIKTLKDDQATKENILELKSFIANARRDDVVILFIAGHGILDSKLDYYYCTYDTDFSNPAERGLSYSNIEQMLDGITALKKIILMDTCHSGEVDKIEVEGQTSLISEEVTYRSNIKVLKRGARTLNGEKEEVKTRNKLMKVAFLDLRRGIGANIISSSGGAEYSIEGDKWQNGLFTYCLMNGLESGKADINKDKEISLSEIKMYVNKEVSKLSNGQQTPTSRRENIEFDFKFW